MAKRWINSADVEVSAAGALLTEAGGFASLTGGTKTVAAAATPEELGATAAPCRMVWVGAPIDPATGLGTNTKPAFIGDSDGQTMPLVPSNFEGYFLPIDDASKVYVKVGANGEKVNYRIFA